VIRNCNSLQRLRLFAASALPCLLLCLPFLCLPLGFLVIGEKALAAESPESLVSKFSGALPEGATVTTTSKNVANYKLLVSAAEKVKRELRATETIQVAGLRTRTLWQLPSGAELDEVFAAVSAQMEGEELFSCSGRDCGRSTAWSTLVFSEALMRLMRKMRQKMFWLNRQGSPGRLLGPRWCRQVLQGSLLSQARLVS